MTRLDQLYGEWSLAIARGNRQEAETLRQQIIAYEQELDLALLKLFPGAHLPKENFYAPRNNA